MVLLTSIRLGIRDYSISSAPCGASGKATVMPSSDSQSGFSQSKHSSFSFECASSDSHDESSVAVAAFADGGVDSDARRRRRITRITTSSATTTAATIPQKLGEPTNVDDASPCAAEVGRRVSVADRPNTTEKGSRIEAELRPDSVAPSECAGGDDRESTETAIDEGGKAAERVNETVRPEGSESENAAD
jgi:hypothetical protein